MSGQTWEGERAALAVHTSFCPSEAVLSSWLALQGDGLLLCRWHQEPSALQAVVSVQGPEAVHSDCSFFLFPSEGSEKTEESVSSTPVIEGESEEPTVTEFQKDPEACQPAPGSAPFPKIHSRRFRE